MGAATSQRESLGTVDVVVVGAGVSGLVCARSLVRSGLTVKVVDARPRLGGRIETLRVPAESPLELGAQVLHGSPADVVEAVRGAGLTIRPLAAAERFVVGPVEEPAGDETASPWRAEAALAREWGPEVTVAEALERSGWGGAAATTAAAWFAQRWCADPRDLSAACVAQRGEGAGEQHVVVDGLTRWVQWLGADLETWLSCRVEGISVSSGKALVETTTGTIAARAVAVTVPPRTLTAIRFTPSLPPEKTAAAKQVGVGGAVVVAARMRRPATDSAVGLVVGNAAAMWRRDAGSTILRGWFKGPPAERAARSPWTPERVANHAAYVFPSLSATDLRGEVVVRDWTSDPFAAGGYSYPSVRCPGAPGVLAESVGDVLFFAGEATCVEDQGLIQSALRSGVRAAEQIADAVGATLPGSVGPAPLPRRRHAAPRMTYDPNAPDVRANPYPAYEALRRNDPVQFNAVAGMWFVSRYADCRKVLDSPQFSQHEGQAEHRRLGAGLTTSLLTSAPETHARLRSAAAPALSGEVARAVCAEAEDRAGVLLASSPGDVDVIRGLARPVTEHVFFRLFGIDDAEHARFIRALDTATHLLDPLAPPQALEHGEAAAEELEDGIREAFSSRDPASPVVRALSGAVGRDITVDEAVMTCLLAMIGGFAPTIHLIGNGLNAVATAGVSLGGILESASLRSHAVDELVRFDSPIQFTARMCVEGTDLGGRRIARGQLVIALIGAANHDPAVFESPQRLDLARRPNPHLGFGAGAHFCLGAGLARCVTGAVVAAVARRWAGLIVVGRPRRAAGAIPRGFDSLLVKGTAAGSLAAGSDRHDAGPPFDRPPIP